MLIEEYADFNSNKATYSKYLRDLEKIKEASQKKTYYFKLPKYQESEFKYIESDLQRVETMGKIIDNSNSQIPIVIFNTESVGVFDYRESRQSFVPLQILDEENLAEKIPKAFKGVFIGNESFMLAGGYDSK